MAELRERQVANKITPGYYGEYAKFRNITEEEAIERINNGESYILRLKSPGNIENRVEFHDLIKGDISFPENNQDVVIIKGDGLPTYHFAHAIDDYLMRTTHVIRGEEWLSSLPIHVENNQDVVIIKGDGLPTYHFAHAIDDYLMRTTHVIRGEEWLSSLPIHVQLFDVLGFERPQYAHIPTIMKQEGGSKRKLSKRKDAEAAVSYYKEVGYPTVCVIEYLLNIVNSTYEEWRAENPTADYHEFNVQLEKMSKSGALFDLVKLNDVSKDVIARMPANEVYDQYTTWAKEFDNEMFELITSNETMAKEVFNIDKEGPKPRKDFAKWDEVKDKIFYFFDELFYNETAEQVELPKTLSLENAKAVIEEYAKRFTFNIGSQEIFYFFDELFYNETAEQVELPKTLSLENAKAVIEEYAKRFTFNIGSQETWFEELKAIGTELGYCANRKEFKANPDAFKGMISDVAGAVRSALSHRTNTPDLYTIMQIMGEEKVRERFERFLSL